MVPARRPDLWGIPGPGASFSIRAMVDDPLPGGASGASICPWCSARFDGNPDTCPSCGATFEGETVDPSLPGLTAIDAAAIVRAKQPTTRSRNRLLSWISGDYPEEESTPADAGALAPPDLEVRREILRLELEAEVANLQAEAEALRAEATVEGRADDATPEDAAAADQLVAEIDAIEDELESVEEELETAPLTAEAELGIAPDVDAEVAPATVPEPAPAPVTPEPEAERPA
jgi:hypothetical protein